MNMITSFKRGDVIENFLTSMTMSETHKVAIKMNHETAHGETHPTGRPTETLR